MSSRRRIIGFFAIIGLLAAWVGWSYAAPHLRRVIPPEQIELVIASDKSTYMIGECPKISATLTNQSGHTITLVPAIDGSAGRRYPLVKFSVQAPPNAMEEEVLFGCGNVNSLEPSDFHVLPASGQLELLGPWGGAPWTALNRGLGEYIVKLTYDTNETDVELWLGGPLALPQNAIAERRVSALLGEVPRFTVTSNSLKLRFENPYANAEDMLRNGSIAQAKIAMRMIEAGEAIRDLPGALTDSVLKNANWDSGEFREYLSFVLKKLAESISESDLARFWPVLSLDSRTHGQRPFFYSSPNRLNMLRMVLRCPGPNREGRLLDLLEHRVTKGRLSGEARGRLIALDGECAGALFAQSDEDIGRVLQKLIEAGGLDNDQFFMVRTEIERRGLDTRRIQSGS